MNSEFAIALHCLLLLTDRPNQIITSETIAKSACVHPVRIRKIVSLLKRNGYVQSKEGAGGGVYLSCDPRQITLDALYRLTSFGTLKPKCPQNANHCLVSTKIEDVLGNIFHQAERQVERFLHQYTIYDVLSQIKQEPSK